MILSRISNAVYLYSTYQIVMVRFGYW